MHIIWLLICLPGAWINMYISNGCFLLNHILIIFFTSLNFSSASGPWLPHRLNHPFWLGPLPCAINLSQKPNQSHSKSLGGEYAFPAVVESFLYARNSNCQSILFNKLLICIGTLFIFSYPLFQFQYAFFIVFPIKICQNCFLLSSIHIKQMWWRDETVACVIQDMYLFIVA